MRRGSIVSLIAVLAMWTAMSATSGAQEAVRGPLPAPPVPDAGLSSNDSGLEVMMRGPVHEAFAEPVNLTAAPPPLVTRRPPDPIDEIPPDAKPADENVVWIGGYWAWDDDRNDFIWVSGIWRVPPMGEQWVPGYWTEAPGGYRWVPGFWTPAATQQLVYYPQPPESLEQGPLGDPPTEDSIWIPGSWRWGEGRYVWQAGYWGLGHQGLVWVPATYSWSPNGWVFSDGYWDFPLAERGVLFAPVQFTTAVYLRPSYRLIPSVVIDPEALHFHLFVRPAYYHYYFGDYYAPTYERAGIYPWFEVHRHHRYHYDPLFAYSQWYYRHRNPRWVDQWREWYHHYREHADWRPPHNFVELQERRSRGGERPDRRFLSLADTVQDLLRNPRAFVRFAPLSAEQRETLDRRTQELSHFRRERTELETRAMAGPTATPGKPSAGATAELNAPRRVTIPRLPATEPLGRGTPRTAAKPIFGPEGASGEIRNRGESLPGVAPSPGTSPTPGTPFGVRPRTGMSPLPGTREPEGPPLGGPKEPLTNPSPKPERAPLPGSPGYHPELRKGNDLRSGTTRGLGTSPVQGIPGIDAGRPGSGTNLPPGVVPRIGERQTPAMPQARTPGQAESPAPSTWFPGRLMPRGTPSNTDLLPRFGQESPLVPRHPAPESFRGTNSPVPPATGPVPGMAPREIPEIPRLGRRPDYVPGGARLEPPRQATPRTSAAPSREPPSSGRNEAEREKERPERR